MNIKIMFTQGKDKRKNEFAEWHDGWNGVIFVDYAILTLPLPLTLALALALIPMFKSFKFRARLWY